VSPALQAYLKIIAIYFRLLRVFTGWWAKLWGAGSQMPCTFELFGASLPGAGWYKHPDGADQSFEAIIVQQRRGRLEGKTLLTWEINQTSVTPLDNQDSHYCLGIVRSTS